MNKIDTWNMLKLDKTCHNCARQTHAEYGWYCGYKQSADLELNGEFIMCYRMWANPSDKCVDNWKWKR